MRPKYFTGFLLFLLAISWFLAVRFYIQAKYLKTANDLYLKQRNQIIEKLASVYYAAAQIDAIIKKLGLSASLLEKNFKLPTLKYPAQHNDDAFLRSSPFREQIAALLLLQHTPLQIGTSLFPVVLPKIEARVRTVLDSAENLRGMYDRFKINLFTIPSILPVVGRLKSFFGYRKHPLHGNKQFHSGIDIAGAPGTPVVAAADGLIIFASRKGGYGNTVIIRHSLDLETQYSHLERMLVKNSQQVRRGQVIGLIGSTGVATGPHLHYEVHVHNAPQDPLQFIFN